MLGMVVDGCVNKLSLNASTGSLCYTARRNLEDYDTNIGLEYPVPTKRKRRFGNRSYGINGMNALRHSPPTEEPNASIDNFSDKNFTHPWWT